MANYKISIIIPVFNTKREYLIKCLESVIKQSVKPFEIIIVDDGSDSIETKNTLKELVSAYHQIQLISQINQGVSVARNNGFNQSTGEFICFIDPDDWISELYLEKLVNSLIKNDADFVLCDCCCTKDDKLVNNKFLLYNDEKVIVNEAKNELLYQLIGKRICRFYPDEIAVGVVWAKMFKRQFIESSNLTFVQGMARMEDSIYCMYAIENAEKICYLPESLYFYRREDNSASFCYSPKVVSYFEKFFDEAEKFLDSFNKEKILYSALRMRKLTSFNSYFTQYIMYLGKKERNATLNSLIKREPYYSALKNLNYSILTTQEKIFVFLLKHKQFSIINFLIKLRNRKKYRM